MLFFLWLGLIHRAPDMCSTWLKRRLNLIIGDCINSKQRFALCRLGVPTDTLVWFFCGAEGNEARICVLENK